MNSKNRKHFNRVLSHLYINPLERCNLHCKICYTRKTGPILSDAAILEFVDRYQKSHRLETVTFCGGEVFTLPYFPGLVNKLTNSKGDGIFIQIITNGTIDKLDQFNHPNMINLIVSIDGLQPYHDKNRGEGNFDKSMKFLKKAKARGFHTEIFSIVTGQNINQIDEFEKYLEDTLGEIAVTYHPRKPPGYLLHHPVSNVFGETQGFDFPTDEEMVKIMKERRTFPPKNLGCYQIALTSDGKVYGCCEGTVPIGKITDDIDVLFDKLEERIGIWEKTNRITNCLGCSQPEFMCGMKRYLMNNQ